MGYKLAISIAVLATAYYVRNYDTTAPLVKGPVVKISAGEVQGIISKSRDGRDFYEYLGIPYAKSPVGELRFEPPEPWTGKWDDVRDATSPGAVCIQADYFQQGVVGEEDCLFVNVHTPKLQSANLPVMVWIHGGVFYFGSGSWYRPDYLMDEDVVLVTVNYRLASLGFLNTGDGVIRGNMGLKDQTMALRWVKDNIAQFGGNPNDVTLYGQSAGGASVHFQMLSPMSKGLFHKAITLSGLATLPLAIHPSPAKQAERFAKQLKCSSPNTQDVVKCLKGLKAVDIVSVHKEVWEPARPMITFFRPTIEKYISDGKTFITEKPKTLIQSGNFNQVPFLAGTNSGEGLFVSIRVANNKTLLTSLDTNWDETATNLMMLSEDLGSQVHDKIRKFYLNGQLDIENPLKQMENLTNLFSDSVWQLGFHEGMKSHTKLKQSSPLFIYYYNYEGEFSFCDVLLSMEGQFHPIVEAFILKATNWFLTIMGIEIPRYGACHGDELAMQFNLPGLVTVPKDSRDYVFSKKIVKLMTSFAKNGGNKGLEFMGQKWPPQEQNKPLKYMQLDVSSKYIDEPFKDRLDFWNPLNIV